MEQTIMKYGRVNEGAGTNGLVPVTMAASQAIKELGGKFVFLTAGAAALVDNDSTTIYGWLNCHEKTPTVGDVLGCDISLDAEYRIPIQSGTYAEGMKGDFCDLDIDDNGIQSAVLGTSTRNHVVIVDGDAVNNAWVIVKMNPLIARTGIGADD